MEPVQRFERARAVGLWLRDTGLGAVGYLLVALVAVAGWSGSFIGLHQFAQAHMGLDATAAWFVPVTFDGAALGLTVCVARAAMHGRGAMVWRGLVVAFTALSSWINWTHIDDPRGRLVAALLPISAVTVFEGLMSEARAAYERRTGRTRPRLHPLRWVFDFAGTRAILRAYVLDLPLPDRYLPGGPAGATETPTPPATAVAPLAPLADTAGGSATDTWGATGGATVTGGVALPDATVAHRSGAGSGAAAGRGGGKRRRPHRNTTVAAGRGQAGDNKVSRMRAHWDAQVGAGRVPTGAELAEAADAATSLGRRKAAEWRQELPAHLRETNGPSATVTDTPAAPPATATSAVQEPVGGTGDTSTADMRTPDDGATNQDQTPRLALVASDTDDTDACTATGAGAGAGAVDEAVPAGELAGGWR